jgi:hypothetical protein
MSAFKVDPWYYSTYKLAISAVWGEVLALILPLDTHSYLGWLRRQQVKLG